MKLPAYLFSLLLIQSVAFAAADFSNTALLPPIKSWSGTSEKLIQDQSNPWQTPVEAMALTDTPDYQTSIEYLQKLVESEPMFHLTSLGKSDQNRDLWMLIASRDGASTPKQLAANHKPTLLVQAGIHSGEIDGKDAGLMLLRDISKGGKMALLDKVNMLFIPIFNLDGHERRSENNRVNQRGPIHMGWRTNSLNLNLNRDYTKADTLEMQYLLQAINQWEPDLYFDIHVTDGEDYQYDITYGFNADYADSPNISRWLSSNLRPQVDQALKENGHLGGPLVFGVDPQDFAKGIVGWTASPRFSNGYGDVRHLPTVLVENHSLKPYKRRVLGTYVFLEQSLKTLAAEGDALKKAIKKDQQAHPAEQVLSWSSDREHPEKMDFYGIDYTKKQDSITGIHYVEWNGLSKIYKELPVYWSRIPQEKVKVPDAYWIPAQYQEVIAKIKLHGIQYTTLKKQQLVKVEELKATDFHFDKEPFEGHGRVSATFGAISVEKMLPVGSIRVSTKQNLGALAVALLDPRGEDSLFSWGFFNPMFQRTEYIESYAVVPLAHQMIQQYPELLQAFNQKKQADKAFAEDEEQQMRFFYERSPFYDQQYLKYPVLFELKP